MKSYETVAPSYEELLRRKSKGGRKRSTAVTLMQIHAMLPDVEDPKDRAKLRNVALRLQADPLGIKTGEHAQRPRYGVGEVTSERMAKVQKAGGWVGLEQEKTAKGADTGLQRRRIKSAIEVWFERGAISRASWLAAQALQRDHDLSISCTSSMIAKYQATVGVAHRDLLGQEAAVEFAKAKALALKSVDPIDRPIADWIIACSNDDVPVEAIASRYYPRLSEREAAGRFKALFERCCAALGRHYQLKERHQWEPRVERTARELETLVAA